MAPIRLTLSQLTFLLLSTTIAAQRSPVPTNASRVNATVNINLGLIWDSEEVKANLTTLMIPMLKSVTDRCPLAPRISTTQISAQAYSFAEIPTFEELQAVVTVLTNDNYLFFGIKQNSITQIVENLLVRTSLPEYPVMQTHAVAPMPRPLLLDALMKVIRQRNRESQYPMDSSNFRAALFIDDSVSVSDLYPLITYFKDGFVYFNYNSATMEADLLKVKYSRTFIIIVVVVDAMRGRELRDTALKLNMFTTIYQWFIHGPRLINEGADASLNIISKNITSLEFGRINDALALGVWSTNGVLVSDLLKIWSPYLENYLCEKKMAIKQIVSGFTGKFMLNPDGSATRLNWLITIYSGLGVNREQIGEWNSDGKFEMLSRNDAAKGRTELLEELRARTFRIVTAIAPPYVQFKEGAVNCTKSCNNVLTGMYVEICKLVMKNLNVTNYEFFLQADNAFGVNNGTSWNGILRTVMDGKAMLGCAPFTVSTDRYRIVDFTQLIHASRMSLLLKKSSTDAVLQAFQFVQPLSFQIWLSVFGVLILVALCLFVMDKIAPDKEGEYSLYNSLFFTFAEVVQGTAGTTPSQISGRIVVSFFWFFTLILFLSYIANYAVIRTLESVKQEVSSIDTLLESRSYDAGSIANSVTDSLLRASNYVAMQQMSLLMRETFMNGSVSSMNAALTLINDPNRNFVLINDNLQNQYYADRGCDLVSTGDFYDLKNAMVMPKENLYKRLIDEQLTRLAKNISDLQNYFFSSAIEEPCYDYGFSPTVRRYIPKDVWNKFGALTLSDTLGILVVNLLGCCIALALAGVEKAIGRLLQSRSEDSREQQLQKAMEKKFKRPTTAPSPTKNARSTL